MQHEREGLEVKVSKGPVKALTVVPSGWMTPYVTASRIMIMQCSLARDFAKLYFEVILTLLDWIL